MIKDLLYNITQQINVSMHSYSSLPGGDINQVFLIETTSGKFVVKLNDSKAYPNMFVAEARGLQLLSKRSSFVVPRVIKLGEVGNYAYLILDYFSPGIKNNEFSSDFGKKLAEMHLQKDIYFGLDHDNYIGALPQKNALLKSAKDFYIQQRLIPQFTMASQKGYHFDDLSVFYERVGSLIPDEAPSLIHGDLWNGNYLVEESGLPVLIDPAVAYAPREMDLAMMKLFGGFDKKVFDVYNAFYPLERGWNSRIELFQLYYLLVHLNLFGRSYLGAVERIVRKFTF